MNLIKSWGGKKLNFFFTRLQKASLPEISYRFREFYYMAQMRHRYRKGGTPFEGSVTQRANFNSLHLPTLQCRVSNSVIESLLNGAVFSLNLKREEINEFENLTRRQFSGDISINQGGLDIRMVWEPARLQNLAILLACIQNHYNKIIASEPSVPFEDSFSLNHQVDPLLAEGEETIKDGCGGCSNNLLHDIKEFVKESLFEWLAGNPFLTGPHYLSVMECGLRIPVFFYALKILDNLASAEQQRILLAIYQHAWWISRRLSLFSSVGNHTVCECVGLIFSGAIFSSDREGISWLNRGLDLLQKELFHQILADGGPVEQSLNYHRFVLDLYWLSVEFLEKNHLHDCTVWKSRLQLGENFFQNFTDGHGNFPAIGDSDDGHALAPGISPLRDSIIHNGPKKLLPVSQINWATQDEVIDYQNENFFGAHVKNQVTFKTYPEAGYTIIRTDQGIAFTFDHGPLGMSPLYNHGHADALSITLTLNGKAILVDPGTYRYNGDPEFRQYFKGTRAHNTVTVDGRDQAEQETSFIWSHPFRTQLVHTSKVADGIILRGSQDGYKRLAKPVEHQRAVLFSRGCCFLIRDTFSGVGIHDFELNYHLHPEATIISEREWLVIKHGEERVYIRLLFGGNFNIISGQEKPPLGWFSPAYGVKLKSGVLNFNQIGNVRDIRFLTIICVGSPRDADFPWEMVNFCEEPA